MLTYDFWAFYYDLMDLILWPNKNNNPRKKLSELIPGSAKNILDICVGTANSSIWINHDHPDSLIYGIDLNEKMLKIANSKVINKKNIVLKKMDATKTEFPDNEFDCVIMTFALHEFQENIRIEIFREIKRILKPEGIFYILEWERPVKILPGLLFRWLPESWENKDFNNFLNIKWDEYIALNGFSLNEINHYNYSKIISARRML